MVDDVAVAQWCLSVYDGVMISSIACPFCTRHVNLMYQQASRAVPDPDVTLGEGQVRLKILECPTLKCPSCDRYWWGTGPANRPVFDMDTWEFLR